MRLGIVILTLSIQLSSSLSAACKCDEGLVRSLYENPATAQTAFIGKSEGDGKDRVFRVVYSWTTYHAIFKAPYESKCNPPTLAGHTYLVFSFNTSEFIEKRKMGFTICDSVVSEIDDAEPLIEKLANRKVDDELMPNPTWFYCARNQECVREQGSCSESVGVNKKFRERFRLWTRKVAPSINCLSSAAAPTGKASCKDFFCVAHSVSNPLNGGALKKQSGGNLKK